MALTCGFDPGGEYDSKFTRYACIWIHYEYINIYMCRVYL